MPFSDHTLVYYIVGSVQLLRDIHQITTVKHSTSHINIALTLIIINPSMIIDTF